MKKLYEYAENLKMSLNEMSQINKKETGNKSYNLPFNKYYVYVKGEGSKNKFPHFHIKSKENGWDIRVLIDGTCHSIKTKGKGMQTKEDLKNFESVTLEWVKQPNLFDGIRTNGKVAEFFWEANN